MRRQTIFITVLALVAAACSAASPSATEAAPPTSLIVTTTSTSPPTTAVQSPPPSAATIELWVPEALETAVAAAADAFSIDTGVGVAVTVIESAALLEQLLADPSAGPDVFIGPHRWLTTLTDAGAVEPLDPRSEVVAGAIEAVTLRGIVYAAPIALDTIVQFRNTAALPSAPNSIESLAAGCPDGDAPVACLLLPADSVDGHYPFLAGLGGYIFGPDDYTGWDASDVGVDSSEALAGGEILQQILDSTGMYTDGTSGVEARFLDEVAPLMWGNTASLAAISGGGVAFVVEQLPSIADRPAPTPVWVTAAWVNAFSPSKEVAATFVGEYLAAPAAADRMAIALGLAPVNIGSDADPNLTPFIESARTGDAVPTIFQTDFAWEELAETFADIRGGDDVAGALRAAAVAIRKAPAPPEPEAAEDA